MKLTVQKFDPSVDPAPYYAEYEVPHTENMTVLEAVMYVNENIDPLSYDYSCRGRMCGRCAMMLNGRACTACTTAIPDQDNVVEPLPGFPIVRDLVVDKSSLHDTMSRLDLRVRANELTLEEFEQPWDFEGVYLPSYELEMCCRCGCCQVSCPVANGSGTMNTYVGPAGMTEIAYRFLDPFDQGDRAMQAVQEGLWNCIMCGMCDEVCPAGIPHLENWQRLRDAATAAGYTEKKRPAYYFSEQ